MDYQKMMISYHEMKLIHEVIYNMEAEIKQNKKDNGTVQKYK